MIREANLGEIRPVLTKLADLDVTLPTLTRKAQEAIAVLQDESCFPMAFPDNLATLSPDELVAEVDRVTFARELDIARKNTRGDFTQTLAGVMAADLKEHTDEILDQLRPTFDKAAQAVTAAHAAGVRANHSAEDILKLHSKAVDLWRKMRTDVDVLDDIAYVRLQLAKAVGAPPGEDQASGAFCASSGLWNAPPRGHRWLALCDHGGPKLNTDAETRAACRRPQRAPFAQEVPMNVDQATLHGILGTPRAVIR